MRLPFPLLFLSLFLSGCVTTLGSSGEHFDNPQFRFALQTALENNQQGETTNYTYKILGQKISGGSVSPWTTYQRKSDGLVCRIFMQTEKLGLSLVSENHIACRENGSWKVWEAGKYYLNSHNLHPDYRRVKFGEFKNVILESIRKTRTQTSQNRHSRTPNLSLPARRTPTRPAPVQRNETPDIEHPLIGLPSTITVKSDSVVINGTVTDDTEVAFLTAENKRIPLKSDGSFEVSLYIPVGGKEVKFEASDVWNKRSTHTVRFIRNRVASSLPTPVGLDPRKVSTERNSNSVALIIGIEKYKNLPDAQFADKDAQVFSDFAINALGVPPSRVKLLLNENATEVSIKKVVRGWLRSLIIENKTNVYIFYAGHGLAAASGNDLYLLPYDGDTDLLQDSSIKRTELFDDISQQSPKSVTVFLDTCYSGITRNAEQLLANARGLRIQLKTQRAIPNRFTVFSAASNDEVALGYTEAKHGVFSYFAMKGMEGKADRDGDKKITASELSHYVRVKVQNQVLNAGKRQTPLMVGNGERVLVDWSK
jgi:hypothetical protein